MLRSVGLIVAAAMLTGVGCLRLRAYRAVPRPEIRYLGLALVALGLSLLLNVVPIIRGLDRVVWHRANVTVLLSHALGLITAWGGIELCAEVSGTARLGRRARVGALIVGWLALASTFVAAGQLREEPMFFEYYARDDHLRAYWVVFIGLLVIATAYLSFIARRHTHHDDRWLRRGLNLISLGAGVDCLFALSRLVAVFLALPDWVDGASLAALVAGSTLLAGGVILPQAALVRRHERTRRALLPVWEAVTAAYPQVRMSEYPATVYRALIEIHDALAHARGQGPLTSPLLQALDQIPPRAGDDLAAAIDDLLSAVAASQAMP